jgi:hypothetical protein
LYQIRKFYSSISVASAVFETNFTIDELIFFIGSSNGRTFSSGRLNGNCNAEAGKMVGKRPVAKSAPGLLAASLFTAFRNYESAGKSAAPGVKPPALI